jgi:hypothetical protein
VILLSDFQAGLFDIPNAQVQTFSYSSELLSGILHVMILSRHIPAMAGER